MSLSAAYAQSFPPPSSSSPTSAPPNLAGPPGSAEGKSIEIIVEEMLAPHQQTSRQLLRTRMVCLPPPTAVAAAQMILEAWQNGASAGVLLPLTYLMQRGGNSLSLLASTPIAIMAKFADRLSPMLSMTESVGLLAFMRRAYPVFQDIPITAEQLQRFSLALKRKGLSLRFRQIPDFVVELHGLIDWDEELPLPERRYPLKVGSQSMTLLAQEAHTYIQTEDRGSDEFYRRDKARWQAVAFFTETRDELKLALREDAHTINSFSMFHQDDAFLYYLDHVCPSDGDHQPSFDAFMARSKLRIGCLSDEAAVEIALEQLRKSIAWSSFLKHLIDSLVNVD